MSARSGQNPTTRQRCAIYTRVSTEHGLDMEFNSLDAQREACAAYIQSQKHEGWTLVPETYADGGYSGGSLDRPDLARLLDAIRARRIDVIVVYKVDRLTRSLADFAKLVELFDAHGVSFVSVTQSFNTTSSMGRLTLNVLLSFAQFEREVTGERIRDKIAASKKKGIRMGGPVPLGYTLKDKRLVIDEAEATSVRRIFTLYLETGALGPTLQVLDLEKIVTKRTRQKDGTSRGGVRFGKGALCYLLRNRAYRGEIGHKGTWYASDHAPIIDAETFAMVQARLDTAGTATGVQRREASGAFPLAGRIWDDRGNRMTPTFAKKNGAHYRYYVSTALHQGRRAEAGTIARVSADEIEAVILHEVRTLDADIPAVAADQAIDVLQQQPSTGRIEDARMVASGHASYDVAQSARSDAALAHIINVTVHLGHLSAEVRLGEATRHLVIPWSSSVQRRAKGILPTTSKDTDAQCSRDPKVIESTKRRLADIARAQCWIDDLIHGRAASITALAARNNLSERLIRLKIDLAFTRPQEISAMIRALEGCDLTSASQPAR